MFIAIALLAAAAQAQPAAPPNGRALFDQRCASCHTAEADQRVPTVAELRARTPESIVTALTTGSMREQGAALGDAEKRAIAEFLAGNLVGPAAASEAGRCTAPPPFDASSPPLWGGWSPAADNTRFQTAAQAGLDAAQVPKLRLKWAFGFADAAVARALPTVAGGRVFVGSQSGLVYALDAKTGCTIWTLQANAGVRTGVVIGPRPGGGVSAYFGDGRANVYAVDPEDGRVLWTRRVDEHPNSHVIGTPALHQDRLYVAVSSLEEAQALNRAHECCTFRGSVVAVAAGSGEIVWKTHTIAEEAKIVGTSPGGARRWGPSGAAIWAAPTVDAKRRVVYAATGNMYTEPQQPTSDAVIAFDLDSGRIVWTRQATPQDLFVMGCGPKGGVNCPPGAELGPDFDFGNPPMLVTVPATASAPARDLIVIGQKSGVGWALDPDDHGAIVWQYRAGRGSALGGMEFGSAADAERAYFPLAEMNGPQAGEIHAVTLRDGERVWVAPPPPTACGERGRGCTPAILAAITAMPGVVFAGSNDGGIRGFSSADGKLLWEYDTNREFETVNGVAAKGASINGPGPVVAGGMLYVNSGYGSLGGRAGNVLLAFGVD